MRYWPEGIGQTEVFGTFQVEVLDERVLGEYSVMKLKLSPVDMVGGVFAVSDITPPPFLLLHLSFSSSLYPQPQESRTITHFHYTKWTEKACPPAAADLIDLIGEVLRVQRKSGNGPITVHCR